MPQRKTNDDGSLFHIPRRFEKCKASMEIKYFQVYIPYQRPSARRGTRLSEGTSRCTSTRGRRRSCPSAGVSRPRRLRTWTSSRWRWAARARSGRSWRWSGARQPSASMPRPTTAPATPSRGPLGVAASPSRSPTGTTTTTTTSTPPTNASPQVVTSISYSLLLTTYANFR